MLWVQHSEAWHIPNPILGSLPFSKPISCGAHPSMANPRRMLQPADFLCGLMGCRVTAGELCSPTCTVNKEGVGVPGVPQAWERATRAIPLCSWQSDTERTAWVDLVIPCLHRKAWMMVLGLGSPFQAHLSPNRG